MWSQLLDWAFHWTLLWIAFELGKRWSEKDVAASIAALTEKQSRRRSQEITDTTPEKVCVQLKRGLIVRNGEVLLGRVRR
jgi:urease accessory protein UreE